MTHFGPKPVGIYSWPLISRVDISYFPCCLQLYIFSTVSVTIFVSFSLRSLVTIVELSAVNVSETCPALLEKRVVDIRCEWMFQHRPLQRGSAGHSFYTVSLAYPRMFLLLINLALRRKLIPYLNFELNSLKLKVYITCRYVT